MQTTQQIKYTVITAVFITLGHALAVQGKEGPPSYVSMVQSSNDALRTVLQKASFHIDFESVQHLPVLAAGDWHPEIFASPQYVPGYIGNALVIGTGTLTFAAQENCPFLSLGSLVLWLSPVDWNHEKAGYSYFVRSIPGTLFLERQGPLRGPDGYWARNEALLFGVISPEKGPKGNVGRDCTKWENDQWHMPAVNWSWPRLEMSVDGEPFVTTVLPDRPPPGLFKRLIIGSSTGDDKTLLDELWCLRYPLSDAEVAALYQAFREAQSLSFKQ